jgi:hypothetical protein
MRTMTDAVKSDRGFPGPPSSNYSQMASQDIAMEDLRDPEITAFASCLDCVSTIQGPHPSTLVSTLL